MIKEGILEHYEGKRKIEKRKISVSSWVSMFDGWDKNDIINKTLNVCRKVFKIIIL